MNNRTSGMGLLVFGVVLAVVGAIMRYAVEVDTEGFNIHGAGVILLIVGVIAVVVGLAIVATGRRTHTTVTDSIQQTPVGEVRTQERTGSTTDW